MLVGLSSLDHMTYEIEESCRGRCCLYGHDYDFQDQHQGDGQVHIRPMFEHYDSEEDFDVTEVNEKLWIDSATWPNPGKYTLRPIHVRDEQDRFIKEI